MPKPPIQRPGIVDYVIDSLSDLGIVESKRFFGGWSLQLHGRQFACVINDELFFSAEGSVRDELIAAGSRPFSYEKVGKTIVVGKFQSAPASCLDDSDELERWVRKLIHF